MYALAQNEEFKGKIRIATIKAANAILNDNNREPEHPCCNLIIQEPMSDYWLRQIIFSVVSNPAITEAAPDNDIEFTVNSVFEKHALAFHPQ